jgi:hypothetical protein
LQVAGGGTIAQQQNLPSGGHLVVGKPLLHQGRPGLPQGF